MTEYNRQNNDPQGFNTRGHVITAHLSKPEHTWWYDAPKPSIIWETNLEDDFDKERRVENLLHGCRIAITPEGYPVIVPRSARLRDLIVALYGIRLFFVIRLQLDLAENSGCYTLVGLDSIRIRPESIARSTDFLTLKCRVDQQLLVTINCLFKK